MEIVTFWIPFASTFSVLAPLFLLLRNFKNYSIEIKALALYLSIGFLVDMVSWYLYSSKNFPANRGLHHAYDLFEAAFLFWFLGRVSYSSRAKFIFSWIWIVLIPFWLMRFYHAEWAGWFKTSTQVLIAFASCFAILRLVEITEDISRDVVVWVLIGIFFYCFCTYFILGTLVFVLDNTWFSHNLVNITTNLIYCIGFIRAKKAVS